MFSKFFSRHYRPGKCLLRYSKTKKHFSRLQKHIVQKVEKLTFSIFPMVFGPKMGIFRKFFFQAIQARKMSFTIFYNGKAAFWAIKTRSSKHRKIHIFPMVLVQNQPFFQIFFQALYARKMSFTIFQNEETPFQAIKNQMFKKSKN